MNSIVLFGSSPFSNIVLGKLVSDDRWSVTSVVTKPDQPSGRGQKMAPNPVKVMAEKYGIPVITSLNTDLCTPNSIGLVAAYGKIIPQNILDTFSSQIFNIHPSLLPKYRGPSPLQQQILDGITETGVSIIQLDAEMDHGPIIAQEKDTVRPDDTWITLGERLFIKGTELFLNSKLDKTQEQNHEEATYTKMITRQDGFVTWNEFNSQLSTLNNELQKKHRAFFEWPGVWTTMPDGKRLKLIALDPEVLIQIEGKSVQSWSSLDLK
jgi:methionyl-tRNA formyltransferase